MPPADGHHRLLRAWQLALLRFAVTRDDCDRVNIAALAGELDRLGRRNTDDSLHFFRRSSSRLCVAINGQQEDAEAILGHFCQQIDESRLRLAFAAALGITGSSPAPSNVRRKRSPDLFRGLPTRQTASL
ncbi:hypothetical protein JQ572_18865 [Bradyrhizobium japonicum]|nr:hypothetical protein [Bradyrhizobium japonicum]